ncbi:hypothetical protein U8335_20525 [Roseiconus lacunae]|uniref:hypothetical protein n=1 Tax=Roseiconus lacunae TaxID=2605694 RepID=UPI003086E1A9|nr:hypothetical protein U8335_20525 [Stieleria sp. HD01]
MRITLRLSIFASAIISLFTHSACLAAPPGKSLKVQFLVADDLNSWLLGDADQYAGKVVARCRLGDPNDTPFEFSAKPSPKGYPDR